MRKEREVIENHKKNEVKRLFKLARNNPRIQYKVEQAMPKNNLELSFYARGRCGVIDGNEYTPEEAAQLMGIGEWHGPNRYEPQMWQKFIKGVVWGRFEALLDEIDRGDLE